MHHGDHTTPCWRWVLFLIWLVATSAQGVSPDGDRRMSEQQHAMVTATTIEREWPLMAPGTVTGYAERLGKELAAAARAVYGPPDFAWSFRVLRDHAITAFAVGGGRIYVSDGALRASKDESEFAAILAHEMGHQIAGHFSPRFRHDRRTAYSSHLPIGPSATMAVDPAMERQADRNSIRILSEAGMDPHGALRMARRVLPQLVARQREAWIRRLWGLSELLQHVPRAHLASSEAFHEAKRQLERP